GVRLPDEQPAQQRDDDEDPDQDDGAGGSQSGLCSFRSGRSRTPRWSSPASRSAMRPLPGSSPSGSIRDHGSSTKARSWASGWGSVSSGSSLTVSPTMIRSM